MDYARFLRRAPRQSRSRSLVAAILSAATEIAMRTSDTDLSVEEIAARAGVGIGSFYEYFQSRETLFAAIMAKFTDDAVRKFEALLREAETEPLDILAARFVDLAISTYADQPRLLRAIHAAAHRTGMMSTIASNQTVFARTLARALAGRADVEQGDDLEARAYVAIHGAMGVMFTQMWEDPPFLQRAELREALISMMVRQFIA
jgi:AcrR family transcriptional regulator